MPTYRPIWILLPTPPFSRTKIGAYDTVIVSAFQSWSRIMPLRVSASQCETHQRMHWENKFYRQLWYYHRHSNSQPHPFQMQVSLLSRLVLVTSRSWVVVDGCCLFLVCHDIPTPHLPIVSGQRSTMQLELMVCSTKYRYWAS